MSVTDGTPETLVSVRGSQFSQVMTTKMLEGAAIAHPTLGCLTPGCPLFETFRKAGGMFER
jgi:hypothetical protein